VTLSVTVSERDGTGNYPLESIASVSGIRYASTWPGGCTTFSCGLSLGPRDTPAGGLLGKLLVVKLAGASVWSGTLDDPQRGVGWQINATGTASEAASTQSLDGSGLPTFSVNTAATQGISRGALPWVGIDSLAPADPTSGTPMVGQTIADVLNLGTASTGKRWGVFADRLLTGYVDPTGVPDYLVLTGSSPGGRSLDYLATHIYAFYIDNAASIAAGRDTLASVVAAVPTTFPARFGRIERTIDISDLGRLTSAQAGVYASAVAANVQPRASFSGSITIPQGQVLAPNGLPLNNATLRAGKVIRFIGQQPDPNSGEAGKTHAIDLLLAGVEYDDASQTVTLSPMGTVQRDLASTIALALAPVTAPEVVTL
jgi:hypothetical protein